MERQINKNCGLSRDKDCGLWREIRNVGGGDCGER